MAKDFKDFASGLQEVHFKLIADTINEMKLGISLPLDQSNINVFVTNLIAANTKVTLELLESYHDWNSQN